MWKSRVVAVAATLSLAACVDSPYAPTTVPQAASLQESAGRGVFQRYVAMGTSISMGVASDGVVASSQEDSWPAQLALMGGRDITQPYIQAPGCHAPIAVPLGGAVRTSGELILAPPASLACAALVDGVTLPTQNVAIDGARVANALGSTPENITDAGRVQLYSRVLPPGATQLTAMAAQNPKLVSVEFGANEILGVQSGIAIAGPPPAPILLPQLFAAQYHQLLEGVAATNPKHVLLVGLSSLTTPLPAFRFGSEIAANAPVLAAGFNVTVAPDCGTTGAQNLIYFVKLATTIQAGLISRQAGGPAVPFTCAAGGPLDADQVLTPDEQGILAAVIAQMNATIQAEAAARGWAYFSLDALYAAPGVRTPLNVVALMTTASPFGPFMSMDGVHPNAAGQALIAAAAAQALDAMYDLGISLP
jgi:lysophospholipase L1-like esterase